MKIKKLLTLLLSSAVILSSGVALAQESSSSSGGSGSSSGGSGSSSSGGGDDWGSGSPACSELSDRTNARCYVEPDDYVMHIIAFRLRKEDGSFLEFPASSTSIDFADGAAGSDLGTWISNIQIPAGVYTAVSPIVSPLVDIRGESDVPGLGTQCRTGTSGVVQDGNSPEQYEADSSAGRIDLFEGTDEVEGQSETSLDFINEDGNQVVVDPEVDGFPIIVQDGDIVTFRFAINPEQGLEFQFDGDGNCAEVSPGGVRVELSSEITSAE